MMRRWCSGKFRDAPPLASIPLWEDAVRRLSAPHVRGAQTKQEKWIAKRDAKTAELVAHNRAAANEQVQF